jgi:hypothetical protein
LASEEGLGSVEIISYDPELLYAHDINLKENKENLQIVTQVFP